MRTITYADLKGRFTSAIGVDSLLTAEETAFKRSLNDRVRGAWTRSKWPELTDVLEKTVAAVADPPFDRAVRIDNSADLLDVFSVWDKNPYADQTASRLDFSLINGYLVLPADSNDTTIYVVGSSVPARTTSRRLKRRGLRTIYSRRSTARSGSNRRIESQ